MRRNSGNIGPLKDSTITSTSGVYDTFDGYNYRLDNLWPRATKVDIVNLTTGSTTLNRGAGYSFRVNAEGYTDQILYITWENVGAGWNATDDTGSASTVVSIVNGVGSFSISTALTSTTLARAAVTFQIGVRTGSAAGTLIATSATYTIPAASITITPSSSSVNQGVSNTISITTSGIFATAILNWSVSTNYVANLNATSGSFNLTNGTGSFSITSNNDWMTTGNITATITISSGAYTLKTGTYTIVDSSTTPTFSVDNSSASEGTTVTFTAYAPGSNGVPFNWFLDTNGGVSGSDFSDSATSGTVYGDGSNNIVIQRSIVNDSLVENENFRLQINNQYGNIVAFTPYVYITDTTTIITGFTATPSISQVEGSSFSISLVGAGLAAKTINWTITPGTGVTAADFSQGLSGTVEGTTPLTLTPVADSTWEGNETFTISFAYNGNTLYTTPTLKIWDTSIEAGANAVVKNLDISTATMLTPSTDNSNTGGGYGDYNYGHKLIYRGSTSTTASRVTCYDQQTGIQDITLDTTSGTYTQVTTNINVAGAGYSGDYLMNFSPDGGRFLLWSPSNSYVLRIYKCSTPWVFNSSDSYTQKTLYVNYSYTKGGKIAISHNGTKVIISYFDSPNNRVTYESVTLPTPFDASSYTASNYFTYVAYRNVTYTSNGSATYMAAAATFEFNRFGTEVTMPISTFGTDTASFVTYALATAYDLSSIPTSTPIATKAFDVGSTSWTTDRIKGIAFDRDYENRLYILYSQDSWNMRVAVATLSLELYGDPPPQEAFDITTLSQGTVSVVTGSQSNSIQPQSIDYSAQTVPSVPTYSGTAVPVMNGSNAARFLTNNGTATQFFESTGSGFNLYLTKSQTSYAPNQDSWAVDKSSVYAAVQLGSGYQGTITSIIDFYPYVAPNGQYIYIVISYYDSNYNYVRFARWSGMGNAVATQPFAFGLWNQNGAGNTMTINFDMDMGYMSGWTYSNRFAQFQFNKDGTKVTMFDKATYQFAGTTAPFKLNTYILNSPYNFTGIDSMTPSATKSLTMPASNPNLGSYNWYMPYSFTFDRVNKNKMYTSHPYNALGYPYFNMGYSLFQEWNFANEVISWNNNTPFATTGMKPLGTRSFTSTSTSFSVGFDTTAHANQFLAFMQAIGDLNNYMISIIWNGKQRNILWFGPSSGSLSSSWSVSGKIVTFSNASASSIYTLNAQVDSLYGYNTVRISFASYSGFTSWPLSSVSKTTNTLKFGFSSATYPTQLKAAFVNSGCGVMDVLGLYASGAPAAPYSIGATNTNVCGAIDATSTTFKMGFQTTVADGSTTFGQYFNFYLAEALGPTVQLAADGVVRPFGPQSVQYMGGSGNVTYDTDAKASLVYSAANAFGYSYNVSVSGTGGGYFNANVWPANGYSVSQQNSTTLYFSYMSNGGSGGPSSADSGVTINVNSMSVSFGGTGPYYFTLSNYSGPDLTWISNNLASIYALTISGGSGPGSSYALTGITGCTYNPAFNGWSITATSATSAGGGYGGAYISISLGVLTPGQNITVGPYNLYYTNMNTNNGSPAAYFNSSTEANNYKNAMIAKAADTAMWTPQFIDGYGQTHSISIPPQYISSNYLYVTNDFEGYGSGYKIYWSGVPSYYFYISPGNSGVNGGTAPAITYFQATGGGAAAVTVTQMYFGNGNPIELDFTTTANQAAQLNIIQASPGAVWKIDAYNGNTGSQDLVYIQFYTTTPDGQGSFPGGAYMYWQSYNFTVLSYQQYSGTKAQGQGTITKM